MSSSISAVGHRVAAVGVVVRRQPGRRPVRRERVVGVAVLADVVELVDHHDVRVRLAAGVGEPPEGRDDRVVAVAEVAAGQDRRCGGPGPARRRSSRRRRAPARGSSRCAARPGSPSSAMFAVCAPKVIRLRSVRWRSRERLEDVREASPAPSRRRSGRSGLDGSRRRPRPRRSASARRRRSATIAMTPPIDVVARIIRWTSKPEREGRIARDPEARRRSPTTVSSNVPDVAGSGRDDRDERDAARQQGGLGDRSARRRPPGRPRGTSPVEAAQATR